MWALALGGLFPAFGALHHRRIGELVDGQRAGWIGIFENPNDLAYGLVVLFPIALALALDSRGARRLLLLATLGVYVAAVLATFSRGGLLGLTAVLVLAVARWTRSWFRLPVLLLLAAGLLFALPGAWQRAEGYGDLREDRSVHQRVDSLRAGLAMAGDRPLLGVGLGCSLLGWEHWAPADRIARKPLHTHNTFVQVLAETGLIGAAVFLALLGAALVKSWRTARAWRRADDPRRARLVSAAEISLWGFLVCSLAGGYLLSWQPYLILGLISAAGAAGRED
jgi:O-antigen ligase